MAIASSTRSLFQATAVGFSGRIGQHLIDAQPVAAVPFSGGISSAALTDVNLQGFIRMAAARVQVSSHYDDDTQYREVSASAVLDGVNIGDIFTADRIVARISLAEHTSGSLTVSALGTHFENLRIGGAPVEIRLDPVGPFDTGAGKTIGASLVRSVETVAPLVQRTGHVLSVQGFGSVAFAELLAGPGMFSLTLLRVQEGLISNVGVELGTLSIAGIKAEAFDRATRDSLAHPAISSKQTPVVARSSARRTASDRISEQGRRLAHALVQKLMSRDTSAYHYSAEEAEIYLMDVQMDVQKFSRAIGCLSKYHLKFPCLAAAGLREPIPILLGLENSVFAAAEAGLLSGELLSKTYEAVVSDISKKGYIALDPEAHIDRISIGDAENHFREALEDFLAVRFDARQSDISASPGHPFTVHTQSLGLTIHISPAYAINPYQSFGNKLSTPVAQYVQPGRWIFGAPQLDTTTMYDVPTQTAAYIAK